MRMQMQAMIAQANHEMELARLHAARVEGFERRQGARAGWCNSRRNCLTPAPWSLSSNARTCWPAMIPCSTNNSCRPGSPHSEDQQQAFRPMGNTLAEALRDRRCVAGPADGRLGADDRIDEFPISESLASECGGRPARGSTPAGQSPTPHPHLPPARAPEIESRHDQQDEMARRNKVF